MVKHFDAAANAREGAATQRPYPFSEAHGMQLHPASGLSQQLLQLDVLTADSRSENTKPMNIEIMPALTAFIEKSRL